MFRTVKVSYRLIRIYRGNLRQMHANTVQEQFPSSTYHLHLETFTELILGSRSTTIANTDPQAPKATKPKEFSSDFLTRA